MVKIINKRPTILGAQAGVRLVPGANQITHEQYQKNREDKAFKNWCKLGYIQVVISANDLVEKAPKAEAANEDSDSVNDSGLSELTAAQAKSLIKTADNIDLLSEWLADETRTTVKRAIRSRIEELTVDLGELLEDDSE